ncbi:MAG: hypothetical protein ACYC6G_10345 [Desulfobaccales bacterium]
MKLHLRKRELVAMFMESPFYFDLRVRERLALLRDHIRRFAFRASQSGVTTLVHSGRVDPSVHAQTRPEASEAGHSTKVIEGYLPLKISMEA